MVARQISVFLENRPGRMAEVLEPLAKAGLNLRAVSVADTTDFGILRIMVDHPEKAVQYLKDAGFTCSITDVISVEIPNTPGALAQVVRILSDQGINVSYLYPFSRSALLLMKTDDNFRAGRILKEAGFKLVDEESLFTEGESL